MNIASVMKKIYRPIFLLFLIGVLLAGCSANPGQPARPATGATPTAAQSVSTATPAATPTLQATKVLFIDPSGSSLKTVLTDLSGKSGLTLVDQPALQKSDLTPEVKVVVLLTPPADLADLLAAAPQAQFIVVSGVDVTAGNNLTVIRAKAENQAFIAGYISTLLSTDFRAAALLPNDTALGTGLKDIFVNGGHYFCGVCAPGWPLKVYYPVTAEQPSTADGPTWQAAAAGLFDNQKAEVFYLSQASLKNEVIAYFQGKTQGEKTVVLLGEQTPPDQLKAQWAATVHFDLAAALQQVWPNVIAGKGGAVQQAAILVDDTSTGLLSAGRMRLVKDLMQKLEAGTLIPDSVPLQ